MAGSGAGSRLPIPLLVVAGVSTLVAVFVSTVSILLQLRNYRKPALQRMVVRIMVMVPMYAIASLISLFSVEAAFFIDAIRDIYEAFVIYCFFSLLVSYLGGERSLLILLLGRPPKEPVFPVNLVKREIDVSDPYTLLFLKRGIFQYVQIKPVLAIVTMVLKATGKFNEGDFRANSGYLYVSIVYNISICLALYCLAMFWVVVNDDLKPFRPVPKFLCVKGILFFSFWQSVIISALVATGIIARLGPYTNPENVSVSLNDLLICIEMPFFAIAHNYAFSYHDFIDAKHSFVARMPMYYAFRDAFGAKDVVEDAKATLRGEGMDYREFEPAEGLMHQGVGLENRIRAGLRYSRGGTRKYWLPRTTAKDGRPPGRAVNKAIKRIVGDDEGVGAPLLGDQVDGVVHLAPDMMRGGEETVWDVAEEGYELAFGDADEADEALFDHCKKYLFGDYNYPTIDVSSEGARITIWAEEERVLRDERGAWFSPIRGSKGVDAMRQREGFSWQGYGAVGKSTMKPPLSSHDGPPEFYGETSGERVIDLEQERMAAAKAADSKDVVMKWTRVQQNDGGGQSMSRTTSHTRNAPVIARTTSESRSGGLSKANALSPDAVDLVKDSRSDEHESRERWKGESSIRGSTLKLSRDVGAGEPHEEGSQDSNKVYNDSGWTTNVAQRDHGPGPTSLRTGHVPTYRYDDIPDDHNPWA